MILHTHSTHKCELNLTVCSVTVLTVQAYDITYGVRYEVVYCMTYDTVQPGSTLVRYFFCTPVEQATEKACVTTRKVRVICERSLS